jgi:hypothetical protein
MVDVDLEALQKKRDEGRRDHLRMRLGGGR